MKRSIPWVTIVGLALTLACGGLYISGLDFVKVLSAKVYDSFISRIHEPPKSGKVVIVDLDDRSLQTLGQWPWSRYLVARLTDRIEACGPSVVAFDIVFPERDRTAPAAIRDDLKRQLGFDVTLQGVPDAFADYDQLFAGSFSNGNVILGCAMDPCDDMVTEPDATVDPFYDGSHLLTRGPSGLTVNTFLRQSRGVTVSIPLLRKASQTAFFNAWVDPDNIVRSTPLIWAYGPNRIYPSLALEAIRIDRGIDQCIVQYDSGGMIALRLHDLVIPCTRNGSLVINFRDVNTEAASGFSSSFARYSAADILAGKVATNALAGKIVFVGTSAVGLRDIKATPLTGLFSGVEVHATMVDDILAGDALNQPNYDEGIEFVGVLLSGALLTLLIARGRAWLSFVFSVAAVVGVMALGLFLLRRFHLVVMPTWMVLSIIVIYIILTTLRYWQEELHKKRVRNMFGTMVSPTVLHYLENNPGSFSLTGVKADATVFFSDVAGFTTISEQLEPEKVSELLNRYLTPMTDIVMAHGGYVDKYAGDSIMAVWGVPYAMKDHAVQACMAAIEQQARLAEIRPLLCKEFGHDIHVRMGLNSGTVTAGNMGSKNRFSYTVMGDVVNQAARYEPANKFYGTAIMIGEPTFRLARDLIETRLLDRMVVKGKTVPVQIYELLGLKGRVEASLIETACLYEEALNLHWQCDWDGALERLATILAHRPDDGPALHMQERIIAYQVHPPPENWTGEYVHASKG